MDLDQALTERAPQEVTAGADTCGVRAQAEGRMQPKPVQVGQLRCAAARVQFAQAAGSDGEVIAGAGATGRLEILEEEVPVRGIVRDAEDGRRPPPPTRSVHQAASVQQGLPILGPVQRLADEARSLAADGVPDDSDGPGRQPAVDRLVGDFPFRDGPTHLGRGHVQNVAPGDPADVARNEPPRAGDLTGDAEPVLGSVQDGDGESVLAQFGRRGRDRQVLGRRHLPADEGQESG